MVGEDTYRGKVSYLIISSLMASCTAFALEFTSSLYRMEVI